MPGGSWGGAMSRRDAPMCSPWADTAQRVRPIPMSRRSANNHHNPSMRMLPLCRSASSVVNLCAGFEGKRSMSEDDGA